MGWGGGVSSLLACHTALLCCWTGIFVFVLYSCSPRVSVYFPLFHILVLQSTITVLQYGIYIRKFVFSHCIGSRKFCYRSESKSKDKVLLISHELFNNTTNTSLRLRSFDSWGANTSLRLRSFDSWGTNTLVCVCSFDSLGTNKFVFLRPFDSWGTNIFVSIQKNRLRLRSSCYRAEESIQRNQFR